MYFLRLFKKLGPGQYKISDLITKKGNYLLSKNRNSCCGIIGKERRFGSDETVAPGPGKCTILLI